MGNTDGKYKFMSEGSNKMLIAFFSVLIGTGILIRSELAALKTEHRADIARLETKVTALEHQQAIIMPKVDKVSEAIPVLQSNLQTTTALLEEIRKYFWEQLKRK